MSLFLCSHILLVSGCTGGGASVEGTEQEADPVVVDFPIAYVKRPLPVEVDDADNESPVIENLREPIAFNPGAALYIRDRATPSATESNITLNAFDTLGADESGDSLYDVKDVEVSYDGLKLIFAMRAPEIEELAEEEQPKWNIWEYDRSSEVLRRIITSEINAEAGHDVAPAYLPDGKIVFASTRQRQAKAVLLDEGKPQFDALDEDRNVTALNLHTMNADGSDIRQITFNQSHDTEPSILSDGKIVFSRWDNYARDVINLYQVNPDGSGLEILYGMESHDTGSEQSNVEFVSPRQAEDGRILAGLQASTSFRLGGEYVFIDWQNFIDINQTTNVSDGLLTFGQISATPFEVRTDDEPSSGGRFANLYPVFDGTGRYLISWTPCRLDSLDAMNNPIIIACSEESLAEDGASEAQPLYGVWIYDPTNGTQLPIVVGQEGVVAHDVVAMSPRDLPTILSSTANNASQDLLDDNVGVVHIKSVYDFDGVDISPLGIEAMADPLQANATDREVRFLRIVKAVSMPDDDLVDLDGTAFGRSQGQSMKDIIGYAAVEPDGSAQFKVPADIAFAINLIDVNGFRVGGRHQNWMSVAAGEVKQCNGCHTRDSELPHGRLDAQAPSINNGAPTDVSPFPNTNAELIADQGETMAQVYSRINGYQDLSVDINFEDVWTDPSLRTIDAPFSYSYGDLLTPAPTSNGCIEQWNSRCRITINYPDIIQPIWELAREEFDAMGNLIQVNTCTSCHGPSDAMQQLQIPEAQLDLTNTPSTDEPDHLTSYRELLFFDNVQEISNDVLIDLMVEAVDANGNPIYEVDADGNLILDADGNPIPVMVAVGVSPALNVNSAATNTRFFQLFGTSGTHQSWLSPAELKLIAEWLDIGGQYYNNPFDVPQ